MVKVDRLQIGRKNGEQFAPVNVFKPGDSVTVRAHVVDNSGNTIKNAMVMLTVLKPDTSTQCTTTGTTDANGYAMITCGTSLQSPVGKWDARLRTISKSGYGTDMAASAKSTQFTLQ